MKKQTIFLLLNSDFSAIEFELDRRINIKNKYLDSYDRIANNILKKRINSIFK